MGWRDGYLYIYCLPPAGGRYAPKVINAPTAPLRGGGMGRRVREKVRGEYV